MAIELEVASAADSSRIVRLLSLAFGFTEEKGEEYLSNVGVENFVLGRRGGKIFACSALLATAHRFHGRWVPASNIAHVAIAPEARGSGLALPFVDGLCRIAHERGDAMVSLFASARPVYRKIGFEVAGTEIVYEAETSALPARAGLTFDRVAIDDPVIRRLYDAETHNEAGLLDRRVAHWNELLRQPHHALEAYVAGGDQPLAYIVLDASDETCLVVRDWYAETHLAAVSVLAFLGKFKSVYPSVCWHGGPHDDLISAMPDKGWRFRKYEEWLARIVDPVKALETRGYFPSTGALNLSITREDGSVLDVFLEVADGMANVRSGRKEWTASLKLQAPAFSTLFSGFRSASRLVRQGLAEADADGAKVADLLFSGPAPWLAEHV